MATQQEYDDILSYKTAAAGTFSPFFLMYNRNPRKAVNFEMERREDEEGDIMSEEEDGDQDEILTRMLEIRERCHSKAKENIAAAQDKQKKQYDAKHNSLKVSLWWSVQHNNKLEELTAVCSP